MELVRQYMVIEGIPSQLSRHDRIYRLSALGKNARYRASDVHAIIQAREMI